MTRARAHTAHRLAPWLLRLWLWALLPTAASAQMRPADDADFWQRMRARAELGLSGRSNATSSFHVVSALLSGDYAFSHGFGAGLDWGFVLGVEAPARSADRWVVGQGDPLLKVWYASPAGRDSFHVYMGLSVPTAWLPRDVIQRGITRNAYAFAAATRGLWNAWLWAPEEITLALGGRYQRELDDHTRLLLEAAVAGGLALSKLTQRVETGYAQLAPAVEFHEGKTSAGVRLQSVLTSTPGDLLHMGAGLYVRVGFGSVQLEAAGYCNLIGPLGLMSSSASVCGTWLAAEVSP